MIDTSKFGTNLFRSKLSQKNGVLIIYQRGWIYGLVFLIVASVIEIVLKRESIEFSGSGIFGYLAAVVFSVIGILYALYVQEISIDTERQKLKVRKGFRGFVTQVVTSFSDVTHVTLKEIKMSITQENTKTNTFSTWDIGIESKINQPPFDIWRAESKDKALHIADTLAKVFGSEIKFESQ